MLPFHLSNPSLHRTLPECILLPHSYNPVSSQTSLSSQTSISPSFTPSSHLRTSWSHPRASHPTGPHLPPVHHPHLVRMSGPLQSRPWSPLLPLSSSAPAWLQPLPLALVGLPALPSSPRGALFLLGMLPAGGCRIRGHADQCHQRQQR